MILFLSVEELKKKMKKNKKFLPNDEIFVPRMLKRKLIFFTFTQIAMQVW